MMTEIHYRISSHHINACTCFWRPIFIGLVSELLLARAGKIIPEDLGLFSFPAGGSTAPSQHCVYIPKQGQLSKTSFTSPSAPPSSNISFKSSQKTCTERISTSDVPTLHNMYWETKCNRLLWGARWTRPCANNLSKQPAQLYDTVHYKQKYATRTVSTHSTDQAHFRSRRLCAHLACEDRMFWHVCVSDLGSLAKEILFDPQSLFLHLDLLQPDLVVSTQHSTLWTGGQLGALLHWSTLGNSLLVHSWGHKIDYVMMLHSIID